LREMLRHNTIEHVKMVEIDGMMVNVSATYLNTWNDCSDIVGSALSCFDDPRADVRIEDALGYFIERFASRNKDPDTGLFKPEIENEKFDVIVMDAFVSFENSHRDRSGCFLTNFVALCVFSETHKMT